MEFIHRALHVAEKKHIAKPNAFLEDAAGTHASTVSRWKRGEGVMSLEQAAGIARALGVSVDYLLGGEEAGARVGGLLTEEQKHILALVEALGLDGNEAMRRLAVSTVYRIGDAIPGEVRVIAERTQTMRYQPPSKSVGSERDVPGQVEQE
jgi:transcriptional regulator with XRE-family HTH domain